MRCKRCRWSVSWWVRDIHTGLCPTCRSVDLAFPDLDEASAARKAVHLHAAECIKRGEKEDGLERKLSECGLSPMDSATVIQEVLATRKPERIVRTMVCPVCQSETDSLKRYHFVKFWLFLIIVSVLKRETHTACPACMRHYLWQRSLLNAIPANLAWFLFLLPTTIFLTFATFTKGHSKNIIEANLPDIH